MGWNLITGVATLASLMVAMAGHGTARADQAENGFPTESPTAASEPAPLAGSMAPAVTEAPAPRLPPWAGLGRHVAESFWGWNLALHFTAVAQTALVSSQGVDYQVRTTFAHHTAWGFAAYPAVILGVAGPVGLIGGLFAKGYWGDRSETLGAAYAVLQANAVTLAYVTVLKLTTGRPPPHDELVGPVAGDMSELSRTFRFGVNRGGVFHGWPSGHVAATMATCSSLVAYYPDSLALKLVGIASVAYMMFGVSSFQGGAMHWFSDAIAGALMAYPIGTAVGAGFRDMRDGAARGRTAWLMLPSIGGETTMISVGRLF
jgi:hypothetical protein